MIMVEDSQSKLDRSFQRPMEMTTMEVFLDFDPVFPGWPPDKLLEDPGQKRQKDDLEWRQHRDLHG
jgi:hypothetical protein